jgi:hypothetical protein
MMKSEKFLFLLIAALLTFNFSFAQDAKDVGLQAITKQAVQGQLEFLASDWTQGRHTGRPGAYMAADYIASLFKVYGLEPGGDSERNYPSHAERMEGKSLTDYHSYFQNFDLIEYKAGENHEFSIIDNSATGTKPQISPTTPISRFKRPTLLWKWKYRLFLPDMDSAMKKAAMMTLRE